MCNRLMLFFVAVLCSLEVSYARSIYVDERLATVDGESAINMSGHYEGHNDNFQVDSLLINFVANGGYDFINLDADTITDYSKAASHIRPIGELNNIDQRYVILHYGDSHIHAGIIPQVIRNCAHRRYGNAGPGLIVPYGLSKAGYEPKWYEVDMLDRVDRVSVNSKFSGVKIVDRRVNEAISPGMSGVSFGSFGANSVSEIKEGGLGENESYIMRISTKQKSLGSVIECNEDNRFSSVRIFNDSLAPIIKPMAWFQNLQCCIDSISYTDPEPSEMSTSIFGGKKSNGVELLIQNEGKYSLNNGGISAISLENDEPGVLYHAMGVSSACAVHWTKYCDVLSMSSMLSPDLIIISLGSNEAAGGNFIDKVFYDQIHAMVSRLRYANPNASVLLTTPAQVYKTTRRTGSIPNANYARVAGVINDYAQANGLAVFDLYAISSGEGSAKEWFRHGFLRRDKLHFTSDGYQLQGLLLWRALQKKLDGR